MEKINKKQSELLFKYLFKEDSFETAINTRKSSIKRYEESKEYGLKALINVEKTHIKEIIISQIRYDNSCIENLKMEIWRIERARGRHYEKVFKR